LAQFNRQIRITIGTPGQGGIVVENLKIKFNVDKDITQETNKATVEIWNLTEDNQELCEQPDSVVIIEAGYKEDGGPKRIFAGYVIAAYTKNDGSNTITRIEGSDGQVPIRDAVLSIGYAAGVNGRQIAIDIASKMGLGINVAPDVEFFDFASGFSFVGKGREALSKVCDASGLNWSIQNNQIQIIYNDGITGVFANVYDSDSGLLGSPERIVKAARKADDQLYRDALKTPTATPTPRKDGKPRKQRAKKKKRDKKKRKAQWKIETLLSPSVNPGDAVKVDSRCVAGWFRVESVTHSGETYGGDFKSEMELEEVIIFDD
jgi:hypothetical protein